MTAPVSAGPHGGNATAPNKRGNRLGIISFWLALASLVALVLDLVLVMNADALLWQFAAVAWTGVVVYVGGALAGMAAILIGGIAMIRAALRARRSPPQQPRRDWAFAGLVLGIVATVLLLNPASLFFVLGGFSCAITQACTFFRG